MGLEKLSSNVWSHYLKIYVWLEGRALYRLRYPNCYINPPKKDTAWESRCYRISEHQKEKKDINVLVRLHMELKQIRNQANHAGEDDNRYSIDTVRKALKAYVELYEKIERKLHR